ncbi:formylglycine-generating enzyme family protein [Maribellus sediminis]|uniref:formylglycine-generating enzyme family protein n=1 Tax=Maribellus sediminis TaxID=2696285 RepID=UPI00142F6AD9|nr:formylglycine-generating enzyme family protein [Maribellus sediminis]
MGKFISAFIAFFICFSPLFSHSQHLQKLNFDSDKNERFVQLTDSNGNTIDLNEVTPLFSYEVCSPGQPDQKQMYRVGTDNGNSPFSTQIKFQEYEFGAKGTIIFKNKSSDTLWLTNVLPFGPDEKSVYITGKGDHGLSRTYLFRPGYEAVNVIVPDNAWELGYNERELKDGRKMCALTRRDRESITNGSRRRFETVLYPGGSVAYTFYADLFEGDWQEGLRLMFQERMLYDVEPGTFNNTFFERDDLAWIRHSYLNQAMMAWDHNFYDAEAGKYTLPEFIEMNNKVLGGAEIYGLWPTWPTLGLDQRNQWDLFRTMPSGIEKLNSLSKLSHQNNSHFFIAFNPWDTSTRSEDPYKGMSKMVKDIDADGVVLDCSGASSEQLRNAADKGKKGVVMYSEGMAVPKDMQGIVSGRVHNALYHCPMLNLNKLIKPDFAIFRVVEVGKERIKREYNLSLFNGYGTENNLYSPGRPYWLDEQWEYLAQILMIQRENAFNFTDFDFTPLIPTLLDNVYVNKWPHKDKTIYTIYNLRPEGVFDPLFEVSPDDDSHFVDLWNHEEADLAKIDGKHYLKADLDAFSKKWLGSNNEGSVGVVARFKRQLNTSFNLPTDELRFSANSGKYIRVWAGMPSYQGTFKDYSTHQQILRLLSDFGRSEGKFVVQLFGNENQLIDENIINFPAASARLIGTVQSTENSKSVPEGMVKIPAGTFLLKEKLGDSFIPYPEKLYSDSIQVNAFLMDIHPVTNAQFKTFLDETRYKPADLEHFLKHWKDRNIKTGDENKPVIYVSYEDAQAYASWAGKRLPTETEWQYAAQAGEPDREWPWGKDNNIQKESVFVTNTLTVENLQGVDSTLCNPGDGKYEAVGQYTKGVNPWGLEDLVGSVWQLTNDVYDNGSYNFIMIKGGSYFKAKDSWWYVRGGPQPLTYRQKLLRVSQGFERNATVGFRCVKDVIH